MRKNKLKDKILIELVKKREKTLKLTQSLLANTGERLLLKLWLIEEIKIE